MWTPSRLVVDVPVGDLKAGSSAPIRPEGEWRGSRTHRRHYPRELRAQIENLAIVNGYGIFMNQWHWIRDPPGQSDSYTSSKRYKSAVSLPRQEVWGATVIRWDPKARMLKTVWQNQTNVLGTVCTVSRASEMVYCWGQRDDEWTLEAIDWNTGKNAFHYTLGRGQRFNPMSGLITVAPNGGIDCGCTSGLGLLRINPMPAKTQAPDRPATSGR